MSLQSVENKEHNNMITQENHTGKKPEKNLT